MVINTLRKIINSILTSYNAVLPIISDIIDFTFTYIIALIILALSKAATRPMSLLIISVLIYFFALGFTLESIHKVYEALKPDFNEEKVLRTIIFLLYLTITVLVIYVTLKIYVAMAKQQVHNIQSLIDTISSEFATQLTILNIILYLVPIIGIGLLALKEGAQKGKSKVPTKNNQTVCNS